MTQAYLLNEEFPKAKYIHLLRDGRAVANSVLSLDWGPNTIPVAARSWVKNVSYGLAAESFFNNEKILRVKYENLTLKPIETLKNM